MLRRRFARKRTIKRVTVKRYAARRGRRPRSSYNGRSLTTQRDSKIDYVKRRLTFRARRAARKNNRWRRKVVNTVQNNMIGSTHLIRRNFGVMTASPGFQNAFSASLNGLNGEATDTFNQQNDIGGFLEEMAPSDWLALNTFDVSTTNQRLWVMSANMDLSLFNNGGQPSMVDIYHIKGKRDYPVGVMPSIGQLFFEGFNRQGRANNPENGAIIGEFQLGGGDIGVTPWQNQLFCRYYTILKRTQHFISPGGTVELTIKAPGGVYTAQNVKNLISNTKTRGVLVVVRGPASLDPNIPTLATTIRVLATKRYRVKMLQNNLAKDAFDQAINT